MSIDNGGLPKLSLTHIIARVEEYDINRLGKYLEQELEHHKQLMKEEELTIDRVIEDYGKLIRENNISVCRGTPPRACYSSMSSLLPLSLVSL